LLFDIANTVDGVTSNPLEWYRRGMSKVKKDLRPRLNLDAEVLTALDEARAMPRGPERTAAMKKAGILRSAADLRGIVFAKRRRPAKT
jgi:hypothetical protein